MTARFRLFRLFVAGALMAIAARPSARADEGAAPAGSLTIAAAANLVYALDPLDRGFQTLHPGTELKVTTGASGNLMAQIRNGAPFDLFLSADVDFPRRLMADGAAVRSSFTVFAIGRLALWTTRSDLDLKSIAGTVADPRVRKLAIANPKTAPYGRAAREVLARLGLEESARAKLIQGESISQTAQFVETGNADAGFVALSLLLSPRLKNRGRWIEVPADLHAPIEQGAVITAHGAGNPAARAYLAYLAGPEARKILERFGYRVPGSP